ncbi:4741_t:CDS:2 [Paraglomus brasilianum]|uniref:4741_t:CDS:1 n=1 Tax=Paraglomus brasilianum TaxID=144538 RepID=A0A9N8ZSU3_9GLOM|nr:4741_t:CDS:2 [Paraglomus brasilianum]
MPSKQLSKIHAAKHQPKGVASSGGAQSGVGAIKSQYLVGNRPGDGDNEKTWNMPSKQLSKIHAAKHQPKGVASSGGAQSGVGYCSVSGNVTGFCSCDRWKDF